MTTDVVGGWTFGRVVDRSEIEIEERTPDIPFELIGYEIDAPCDCDAEKAEGDDDQPEHTEACNARTRARQVAGEEVAFPFTARGTAPEGSTLRLMVNADSRGNADIKSVAKWIQACLVPEDRDRWWDTLDEPDVHFQAEAIRDLAEKLVEAYTERPTRSRSERRAGARHNGRTSERVPSVRASR